nr:hypothetical protein CFP56_11858 [Quercus suber]
MCTSSFTVANLGYRPRMVNLQSTLQRSLFTTTHKYILSPQSLERLSSATQATGYTAFCAFSRMSRWLGRVEPHSTAARNASAASLGSRKTWKGWLRLSPPPSTIRCVPGSSELVLRGESGDGCLQFRCRKLLLPVRGRGGGHFEDWKSKLGETGWEMSGCLLLGTVLRIFKCCFLMADACSRMSMSAILDTERSCDCRADICSMNVSGGVFSGLSASVPDQSLKWQRKSMTATTVQQYV